MSWEDQLLFFKKINQKQSHRIDSRVLTGSSLVGYAITLTGFVFQPKPI